MISPNELAQMQSLPLKLKIKKTEQRIIEWYESHQGGVYVSFSGGLDSTVLSHIVHSLYPNVPLVFCNTGIEYPEIVTFVRTNNNVTEVRPEHSYKWVVEKYGYPVISKKVARFLSDCQHASDKNKNVVNLRLTGYTREGNLCPSLKLPEKWKFLIDAPFNISDKCCEHIKKKPMDAYAKSSGRSMMTGELAAESRMRTKTYLRQGCNFYGKTHKSTPLGFWTQQDIFAYIKQNNISYCSIYGDIVCNEGIYSTTKERRSGCYACMFGVHLENGQNRFQRMKESHPILYNFCIDKLGQGKILDYIGVDYK